MLQLLSAFLSISLADAAVAGQYRSSYTSAATALRATLLTGYDRTVPPESNRSAYGSEHSAAGTDVEVQIRFWKVEEIEASDAVMQIKGASANIDPLTLGCFAQPAALIHVPLADP